MVYVFCIFVTIQEQHNIYKVLYKNVTVTTKKIIKTYKNRKNKQKTDVSYNNLIFVDF